MSETNYLKNKNLAYVCLGSNIGDSKQYLQKALNMIANLEGTYIHSVSKIYLTEPQGDKEQPWFHNQVAAIKTSLSPLELLYGLQKIEGLLGRQRDFKRRFGPRCIDLDILMYEACSLNTPELTIPHPRMQERAFVLLPLLDVVNEEIEANIKLYLSRLSYFLDNDKIYQNN